MQHPKPPQYLPVVQIQMQGLPSVVLVLLTVIINIGSVEVGTSWTNRQEHRTVLQQVERYSSHEKCPCHLS